MNLESHQSQKNNSIVLEDFELDFKPLTSGLGFHQQKSTEVKPLVVERRSAPSPRTSSFSTPAKEVNIYQNDLKLFYGRSQALSSPLSRPEFQAKKTQFVQASALQRVLAYVADLVLILSVLGLVLTVMARIIRMDLIDLWREFPHEITPLVVMLFCGFYLMYFSIFEKTSQSTLGKTLFGIRVTNQDHRPLTLSTLLVRSAITLLNFMTLGLFSYFDLQNKVTSSKVVRIG